MIVMFVVYVSCTELKRTAVKFSIFLLIINAVVNLIIGIVVYAQSSGSVEKFQAMTSNEKEFFASNSNQYTVPKL